MNPYNKLSPFKWFVIQNFPFIEEDFDAITEYQLLCKVVEYLNKTIDKTNELGEKVEELNNWFINLDVQDEIDNKLNDMAESGELADIINEEIFEDLNSQIQENKENIENIKLYPYYDILKNGGYSDGLTPNDTIFANAKNDGYKKFYFAQNENNNASYYFTNTPDLNTCEIITDSGVVLNFPNMSGIENTKDAIFKNNIIIDSRQQNRTFTVPKNESDLFNQFSLPNFKIKNPKIKRFNNDTIKIFTFDYSTGLFVDNTSNKDNYYQSIGYDIRYKASANYSLMCLPIDRTKKECIEIVTTPNTHIAYGWLNSESLKGCYSIYSGIADGKYYYLNGVASPSEQTDFSIISNLFSHNGQNSNNNNYALPIKYKLRNDPDNQEIQIFVNDSYLESLPWCANIDYMGFGIYETSTPDISSDNGFSEILQFEQENIPLNNSLNILIAGDSRTFGYNSQYKIEDIIKNGLMNNGANVVNINNISVSGYSIEQVYQSIQNVNLSNYDIVIVATGINNYNSTYQSILQNAYDIMNYCKNNKCFCIMTATIPVGFGGTDALASQRSQVYYKIQQAIVSSVGYIANSKRLSHVATNVMGTTLLSNNIEVCSDGVHPTTNGTILFAKNIVNTILHILD